MNETPDRLHCPQCGYANLHHRTVVVGFRRKEDEAESLVVTVNREGARTEIAPLRGRRDELHLTFTCEHCPSTSTLRIYQHKGETLLEWNAPFGR
jgi:hypothetical protein